MSHYIEHIHIIIINSINILYVNCYCFDLLKLFSNIFLLPSIKCSI